VFPHVFDKGGFDVVIGNPPYVPLQKDKKLSLVLKTLGFHTYTSIGDLYCLFYEKGFNILKRRGILGYVTSSNWMIASYGKELRSFISKNTKPEILVYLGGNAFESAVVDSNILILSKLNTVENICLAIDISNSFDKPNEL
jgi:type I restriction-modification system DNA methylase subunit